MPQIDTLKGDELLERDINMATYSNDKGFHYLQEPGQEPTLSVIDKSRGMHDPTQSTAERIMDSLQDAAVANSSGVNNVTDGTLRDFIDTTQNVITRLS